MDIEIRPEREADQRAVEELTREAFWNLYATGCNEHLLAHNLRLSEAFIPELGHVALVDGQIVGNSMFCRTAIASEVITFGPVSVLPAYKRVTESQKRFMEMANQKED